MGDTFREMLRGGFHPSETTILCGPSQGCLATILYPTPFLWEEVVRNPKEREVKKLKTKQHVGIS